MLDLIKVEKNFFRQKTFFQIKKSFYNKKKNFLRQTFSDLKNGHEKKYKWFNTSDLIDLFGKRYKTDENDETFWGLCLNQINDYFVFLRICELGNCYCVIKNEREFDIRIDIKHNKILVNDIRN